METQTRLSRHNKFISAESIIAIVSVSSDDSLYASLLLQSSECGVSVLMLYAYLQHHNDTIIKTDTMIKTQEDFFIKIFTSHFIARVEKGYSRFAYVRELETEHNWNILTPNLWPSTLCLSRSLMLNRRSRGPLCWLMASFTASYQQLLRSSNSIGVPEGPLGPVWFLPTTSRPSPTPTLLQLQLALDFRLDWAI